MVELSLFEKIKTIFDLIFSSSLFLILLIGIVIILIDVFFISKKNDKVKRIYKIISLIIIFLLFLMYYKEFLNFINVLNKSIVMFINFPSLLQYTVLMFVMLVFMIVGLFIKKKNKFIKNINIVSIFIELFLFFFILDVISKSDIDLNNKINIYANSNLLVLFEMSVFVFLIWFLIICVTKIYYVIIGNKQVPIKEDNKSNKVESEEEEIELPKLIDKNTENMYDEPEMPKTIEELQKEKNKNQKVDLIDGIFTIEEIKQLRKMLNELNKK